MVYTDPLHTVATVSQSPFSSYAQHCRATTLVPHLNHSSKLTFMEHTIKLRLARLGLVHCCWLLEDLVVTPRLICCLIWPTSLKPICLPHSLTTPCLWEYIYTALQRSNYSVYSHTSLGGEAVGLTASVNSLGSLLCHPPCVPFSFYLLPEFIKTVLIMSTAPDQMKKYF